MDDRQIMAQIKSAAGRLRGKVPSVKEQRQLEARLTVLEAQLQALEVRIRNLERRP